MALKDQYVLESAYQQVRQHGFEKDLPRPDTTDKTPRFETVPRRPPTGVGVDGPEQAFQAWASKKGLDSSPNIEELKQAYMAGYLRES